MAKAIPVHSEPKADAPVAPEVKQADAPVAPEVKQAEAKPEPKKAAPKGNPVGTHNAVRVDH